MESPSNGVDVNGQGVRPDAWYCDICGGYFTVEDAAVIGKSSIDADICKECHERGLDTTGGASIN